MPPRCPGVMRSPRVVIAHDYLTQRGGAERTVLALAQAFPGARVLTSVYSPAATFPEFADIEVDTLWLQRVPAFRRDPRLAFPVLARAWSAHTVADADVVVCSSSGWAHGVSTTAPKVVYCHNPARWLYQPDDYFAHVPRAARLVRHTMARRLLAWDRRAAASAAAYLVNSNAVAGRVLLHYGRAGRVVPPPVTLDRGGVREPVAGLEPGFLLCVARGRGYKNVHLVCEAVAGMPERRLVVLGDVPSRYRSCPRIRGVGRVSDAQLRWLYAACTAVVSAAREDFGLTPLEGNLFGKPAALLRAGGFLDTLVDGVTGCFIESESVDAVRDALRRIPDVDPRVLTTYAEGFGPDVFAARVRAAVDEVLGSAATAEVPGQRVSGPPAASRSRRARPPSAAPDAPASRR